MSWELGFNLINALVVPAWALLLVLPRSPITKALVHSMFWPVLMGSIYATLLIASMFFGQAHPDAGFVSGGVVRPQARRAPVLAPDAAHGCGGSAGGSFESDSAPVISIMPPANRRRPSMTARRMQSFPRR